MSHFCDHKPLPCGKKCRIGSCSCLSQLQSGYICLRSFIWSEQNDKRFHTDKTLIFLAADVLQAALEITSLCIFRGSFKGTSGSLVFNSTSNRNLSENGIPFNPKECSREEQVVAKYHKLNINYTANNSPAIRWWICCFSLLFTGTLWLRHILWHL